MQQFFPDDSVHAHLLVKIVSEAIYEDSGCLSRPGEPYA